MSHMFANNIMVYYMVILSIMVEMLSSNHYVRDSRDDESSSYLNVSLRYL